jgi:peptide/nickel transport system substrate-binding protein
MAHYDVALLVNDVGSRRFTRREAIERLIGVGLSAAGLSAAIAAMDAQPARAASSGRGTGGVLRILYWQAPTILNPHLTGSNQDLQAARLCLKPLLTVDAAGVFTPVLASAVPSRTNGGLSPDGRTVTYRLKRGIRWADGCPFTSKDVEFTYRFITNKETASTWYASYNNIERVETPDPSTVRITFVKPTPAWFLPFVGDKSLVLPEHALAAYLGPNARRAPFNLKCFGTGLVQGRRLRAGRPHYVLDQRPVPGVEQTVVQPGAVQRRRRRDIRRARGAGDGRLRLCHQPPG